MTVLLKWNGSEVAAKKQIGAERGLYLWAEEVGTEADKEVPLDVGTLQDSKQVHPPDPGTLRAAVSYNAPPYDIYQHEALDWNHQRGRKAKYLEDPANASKAKGLALVAGEIASELGD
jgi:hypothetical protein